MHREKEARCRGWF